jgi:hypothetical protein
MGTFRNDAKAHMLRACVLVMISCLATQASAQQCGLSICYVSAGDRRSAVLASAFLRNDLLFITSELATQLR